MATASACSWFAGWRPPSQLHRLLLGTGTVLVLLLLGSNLWQATTSLRALDELRHQGERLGHIDGMLIQLMDVEGSARSYLLSGNRDHLAPYQQSQASVRSTLATLRQELEAVPVDGSVVDDLSGLVGHRLEILDRLVERRGRGATRRGSEGNYAVDIGERLSELKAAVIADSHDAFERSTFHLDRARQMVAALAIGVLVLMAALFAVLERQFRLREQLAGMLRDENRRLDALVQDRTADLGDLASYLTEVREVEKERLARELHDELGALLTAAKMETNWLADHASDATATASRDHLARLDAYLERGIALKRRIIDDLRPPFLEELGLVETLRQLGDDFAREGDETVNVVLPDESVALPSPTALALFRIAQEALTNIRKHAHARSVTLALQWTPEKVRLEIADDGIGISPDPTRRSRHGLKGMRHRVQMCAGVFSIASRPEGGTHIVVEVPRGAACSPLHDESALAPAFPRSAVLAVDPESTWDRRRPRTGRNDRRSLWVGGLAAT